MVLPSGTGLSVALGSLALQGALLTLYVPPSLMHLPTVLAFGFLAWIFLCTLLSHGDVGIFYLFFLPLLGVGGQPVVQELP